MREERNTATKKANIVSTINRMTSFYGLFYGIMWFTILCKLSLKIWSVSNRKKDVCRTIDSPSCVHPHSFIWWKLIFYFNSYHHRSKAIRPINRMNKRGELPSGTPLESEAFYMPFELERGLWVYTIAQFWDWTPSITKNNTNSPTNEAISICNYSYAYYQDPMKYFKC